MALGRQGRTECAHEPRDVRAHNLAPSLQFECAQHRVVEEGAALDHRELAEFVRVLELDDLVERVAHHGVRQAGGNVGHVRTLLLRLLDRGIHEHRAARSEVDRRRRFCCGLRERVDVRIHAGREGLKEGSAPRGARLVDRNRINHAVLDLQVLHVLTADVDDGRDARLQKFCRPEVRHRLDFTFVDADRGLDDSFAVSRGTGAHDAGRLRQVGLEALDDLDGGRHRIALVGGVVGEHDAVIGVDENGLDRRRAGVDAEEAVAARIGGLELFDHVFGVSFVEGGPFVVVGKKRAHAVGGGSDGVGLAQNRGHPIQLLDVGGVGEHRRSDGHVELGAVGGHVGLDLVEDALVSGAQFGKEVERAAEEHDVAADRAAVGQARHGLQGDRLEDRRRDVLVCRTLVEQGLDVRLREHAAA